MVCVYSVRAKQRPTVSTPLAWEEVEGAVDAADTDALVFEIGDVLDRLAAHGDLFAPLLTLSQTLEAPHGRLRGAQQRQTARRKSATLSSSVPCRSARGVD